MPVPWMRLCQYPAKTWCQRLRLVSPKSHGRTCWRQCSRLGPAVFPTGVALPAVVEPDEENPEVVLRAFADQEGTARDAAGLVNQGRGGGRPVGADA